MIAGKQLNRAVIFAAALFIFMSNTAFLNAEDVQDKPPSAEAQNDAGSGSDVPAEIGKAHKIGYGLYKGALSDSDKADAYTIPWNPGDTVEILVTPEKSLDIIFYGSMGTRQLSPQNQGIEGEPEGIKMTTDIRDSDITSCTIVLCSVFGTGAYELKIQKSPQDDAGKKEDAPMDWVWPMRIDVVAFEGCYLGEEDYFDDYEIKMKDDKPLIVNVIPCDTLDIAVGSGQYASLHQIDAKDFSDKNPKGQPEQLEVLPDMLGVCKFSVAQMKDTFGSYKLQISVKNEEQ